MFRNVNTFKISLVIIAVLFFGICIILATCDDDPETLISRSYQGHEGNMIDSNNFVNVYRDAFDTRLDDCQTCHTNLEYQYMKKGNLVTAYLNPCDYCHLLKFDDAVIEDEYGPEVLALKPESNEDTLNVYGLAYKDAGRNMDALKSIAADDSDEDGYSNADEIAALRFPGNPNSNPDQDFIPILTLTLEEIQAMPEHSEMLLANASRQEYDEYAFYTGVKIADLLTEIGVDPEDPNISDIAIIAPDAFVKNFYPEDINLQFPDGLYYAGLDNEGLGEGCGFVSYPPDEFIPEGSIDGGAIASDQFLMLAYERDGEPLEASYLDEVDLKLNGEGPYRIVVPQAEPGEPDRGEDYPGGACGADYDYNDDADHNAGSMVRGVVVLKIDPVPEGYEEFDYQNGGWAMINDSELVVYGYGIE